MITIRFVADHRLPLPAAEIETFARHLAGRIGVPGLAAASSPTLGGVEKWINAIAGDLLKHRGACLVIVGEQQSPSVHAFAHAINHALGNAGSTVLYTDSVEANPVNQTESLRQLAADMAAGSVEMLVILGGNPVYDAPADFDFATRMGWVPLRIHLSLYEDETSNLCHRHLPEAHPLESWSDARAFDGTVSIQQPLIAPLYGGKSGHELLAALSGQPGRAGYDIVRGYWKSQKPSPNLESFWRRSVHDGVMEGTAFPPRNVSLRPDFAAQNAAPVIRAKQGLEVVFRTDSTIYDGRFANNGWLQELPKSLTRLTWDNAAMLSPATAQRMGLASEDLVELRLDRRSVRAPVWVLPGQADDTVTVHLGYGRTRSGRVGTGAGFSAYAIRTSSAPWFCDGLELVKTGDRYRLACTQTHHSMEGRNLVRTGTLDDYRREPDFIRKMGESSSPSLSLYPGFQYTGYAWGMAIDLNACIGCNSCVVACQAENNIPIVGKEQVSRGREMHWLRIDRYYRGDLDNPETFHQPVLCMRCENAPCEVVCPVAAPAHSHQGLNDMVYNRCAGTRYCSNNCPYKVRRFNFLQFNDETTPVLKLMRNPDVTVRSRGVMEKCTYCVQRINEACITAEKESRKVRDGEIVTAC